MLAVLVSLAFAATIWGAFVVTASIFEESGAKILAALRPQSGMQPRTFARETLRRQEVGSLAVRGQDLQPLRAAA